MPKASRTDPMAAEPTHHQALMPCWYARPVAPTVEPAPIFAASIVENMRPGPKRRLATKKSDELRTRRPIHSPSAIRDSEYVARMKMWIFTLVQLKTENRERLAPLLHVSSSRIAGEAGRLAGRPDNGVSD